MSIEKAMENRILEQMRIVVPMIVAEEVRKELDRRGLTGNDPTVAQKQAAKVKAPAKPRTGAAGPVTAAPDVEF